MVNSGIPRRRVLLGGAVVAAGVAVQLPGVAVAASGKGASGQRGEQVYRDIYDAFLFGYTLVASEIGMLPRTNYAQAGYDGAPVNQLKFARGIANDGLTNGPNMETAYASAVLDLTAEPLVLTKPEVEANRYFGVLLTSARGAVMPPLGTQGIGGQGAAVYALVGPGFSGATPPGVTRVDCSSNLVFMMIRIREFSDVENDYANVDALQRTLDLRPLSAYGDAGYVPAAGTVDPALDYDPYAKKAAITLVDFFERYNRLSVHNPVEDAYLDLAERFEKYGIGAGKSFTLDSFSPDLAARISSIPQEFESDFPQYYAAYSYTENGWDTVDGRALAPGGDYHLRNVYYYYQPPSVNPPQVFKGYGTFVDSDGNPLDGTSSYRLRFQKDSFPPFAQGGFWSVIAYYGTQMDVPVNSLGRYKLNDLSPLAANPDGTTDIYFQPDAPVDTPESNWLPTAEGEFRFVLRIYGPDGSALSGAWTPPRLEKVR